MEYNGKVYAKILYGSGQKQQQGGGKQEEPEQDNNAKAGSETKKEINDLEESLSSGFAEVLDDIENTIDQYKGLAEQHVEVGGQ